MNTTETTNLFEKPEEAANYFQLFSFKNFKKILYPLAIIALLLILKQALTDHFSVTNRNNAGVLGLLNSFNNHRDFPVWVKTVNLIIEILIIMISLCWEAVSLKKYDTLKWMLLLGLPSIVINIIITYSDLYESGTKSSFYLIYSILSYFSFYAFYGLLRGKILYEKKLSFTGYLIGLIAVVSIDKLYQKIASILLANDFSTPLFSYGLILTRVFLPLSVFYFFFLSDAGFSFKNFVKMPSITLLTKEKFTAHFLILFTSLLAVHFFFTENLSIFQFDSMSSGYWNFVFSLYIIIKFITQLTLVYWVFSQLLLVQLGALGRKPLWIYVLSFIPVVNLLPLFFFFRKSVPVTHEEYYTIAPKEERNKWSLQLFILVSIIIYAFYKYARLGTGSQETFFIIGGIILFYSLILFLRIGIWITLGILGIAVIFLLIQDTRAGLYYFGIASYAVLGLYNLHLALFWETEEYVNIDENTAIQSN